MLSVLLNSSITIVLFVFTSAILALVYYDSYKKTRKGCKEGIVGNELKEPPSPGRIPFIGHLHLLGGYEVPYQAFSALGRRFGNVVKLQLGKVKCVVVNDYRNIREALIVKGHHFDSRPDFQRYKELFSGNKENSLAFCDWSDTHKTRRDMLKMYTFPRAFSNHFAHLDTIISSNTQLAVSQITDNTTTDLKPVLLRCCANIFLNHFCSKNFDTNDEEFVEMVEGFDEIFYEVNQGYAADFLPFLMPFHKKNLKRMSTLTHRIRNFVESKVVEDRYDEFNIENEPNDYIESIIKHVKSDDSTISWDAALFALEDIVGGHSAVGNFLMKVFAYLVNLPHVQKKMQEEIDTVTAGREVTIADRNSMVYTDAVIFEAIRLIASPIVPRVANQDSSINGYRIEKGTVLFLNNYDLSMSDKLWENPNDFIPERFIKGGRLIKPEHFLPFGGGRRSCMGYKMVQLVSFGVLGSFLQNYTIIPADNESYKVPVGSLALKKDTFQFKFLRR